MDDREATDLRYQLRSITRTPIRDVHADALVKVRGTVMLDGPAPVAPISGAPCALYHLDAKLVHGAWTSWDDETSWPDWRSTPLPRESGGRDLILDDGSGRAVVRIARAQLSLLGTWKTAFARAHAQFLAARGAVAPRDRTELEYRELTVVPGEILTIYGRAIHEAGSISPPRSCATSS